ncbi:hypothetical protein GCM10023317_41990 [Actinopolymorpha pittospori]
MSKLWPAGHRSAVGLWVSDSPHTGQDTARTTAGGNRSPPSRVMCGVRMSCCPATDSPDGSVDKDRSAERFDGRNGSASLRRYASRSAPTRLGAA